MSSGEGQAQIVGKKKLKETRVKKEQIDELYHLLRVVSNGDISTEEFARTGRPQREVNRIFHGLSRHLLAGGDYDALIQFSAYYGSRFLLKPACEAIDKTGWAPVGIVELGAGFGWFGRGVSALFESIPCLFVDKRHWVLIDIVADLETEHGLSKVLSAMREGDLIVAADLLHCLDDPKGIMSRFSKWPMAILEYCPISNDYAESYTTQLRRYGANPLATEVFEELFPGRRVDIVDIDPYILLLVEAEK